MSGTMNKVILIGNLARDPEVRSFDNGGRVAKMRILTNETWTDSKDGTRKEQTEGHDVVTYNDRLIDVIEKYVKKGDKVAVIGMNKTRKWQDKDGNDRYSTEVELPRFSGELTMLGSRPQGDGDFGGDDRGGERAPARGGAGNSGGGGRGRDDDRGQSRGGGGGFSQDLDDDVPF